MIKNKEKIYYMWKNEVVAIIEVDRLNKTINLTNILEYKENFIKLPFGFNQKPTIEDLDRLYESRCFPKERADYKDILRNLELNSYDAEQIVRKTHGVMLEDKNWIKFEGEELDYEKDIKFRY